MLKINLTILFSFFASCYSLYGQVVKFKSSSKACDAIKTFLFSPEVVHNYRNENKNDSLLVIVDLTHALDSCELQVWRDKKVRILKEGPLYDSLFKFRLHYLTAGRTNIFLFYAVNISNTTGSFLIQYGRTNVLSTVTFKKKNNKYMLGKIENGVE